MKSKALLGFVLVLTAAPLWGAPGLPDGKWWKRPRLTSEIGLTADQSSEIEKVFVRSRTKLIDLRADLEKKQLALQEAMEDHNSDRHAVEKRIAEVETARAELQKTRALMVLDMKQVLRPQQWERLLEMQREMRERMQERRWEMRGEKRIPEGYPPVGGATRPRPDGRDGPSGKPRADRPHSQDRPQPAPDRRPN